MLETAKDFMSCLAQPNRRLADIFLLTTAAGLLPPEFKRRIFITLMPNIDDLEEDNYVQFELELEGPVTGSKTR
jgi:hypothetical protein